MNEKLVTPSNNTTDHPNLQNWMEYSISTEKVNRMNNATLLVVILKNENI